MLKRLALGAFLVWQAVSLCLAGAIIMTKPLEVALGALTVGLPALILWRVLKGKRK